MDKLLTVISERPKFHQMEKNGDDSFSSSSNLSHSYEKQTSAYSETICLSLETPVLIYLAKNIKKGSKTLETGAGCSTLIFACCDSFHTTVTPLIPEIGLVKEYAHRHDISLDKVHFIQKSSDTFLPTMEEDDFDLILIDGKRAFPWPINDWFYTSKKLKAGGLMIINDADRKSISILVDFMESCNEWEMTGNFSGRTIVFKKKDKPINNASGDRQISNFLQHSRQQMNSRIKVS